ncbi:MAG: ankyrin repeat domain-containing protein [Bacteroidales bacterium]|nr:ankyrin repeat domain-containing protein [Bacteroidales bacterium]
MFSRFTDVNRQSGQDRKTALIIAIEKNNTKKFYSLLNKPGIDVDLGDAYYRTPLMYAFFSGRIEFVNALLQKGANLNLADAGGRTLLYYYAESGKTEVVKALVSLGANIDYYNLEQKNHCLNIMSREMLHAIFSTAMQGDILKILRSNLVSNTVRSSYFSFLVKTQQWKTLVLFFSQLPPDARDIRLLAYETLPADFQNEQIRNTCLRDSVVAGKEKNVTELLRQGAEFDQRDDKGIHLLKLMTPQMLKEVFMCRGKKTAQVVLNLAKEPEGQGIFVNYSEFLKEENDIELIKELLSASLKCPKQDNIASVLTELFYLLPENEIDEKTQQAVFRYANASLAEKIIKLGFDCNFTIPAGRHVLYEVKDQVRKLIFNYLQPESVFTAFKVPAKNQEEAKETNRIAEEYGEYLATGKSWETLKNLVKSDFVERNSKAVMYEILPEDLRDDALSEYLRGFFPEKLDAFDDLPAGLFSFSNEEVIACVKANIDSEYSLSVLAKKIEPDGFSIKDRWENCTVCNGTGVVGNLDAALERDCYAYDCGFCHGKGKVRSELVIYKNKQVIWRL